MRLFKDRHSIDVLIRLCFLFRVSPHIIIYYAQMVLTLTWYVVNEPARLAFRLSESERILLLLPDYIFSRDWITFIFFLRRPAIDYYEAYLFTFIFLIHSKSVFMLCVFWCRCHSRSQHLRFDQWVIKGHVKFIFLFIFSTRHIVDRSNMILLRTNIIILPRRRKMTINQKPLLHLTPMTIINNNPKKKKHGRL